MFFKVRSASDNSATMVAPLLWHRLSFTITRLTFASTYFRNIIRLASIPTAGFLSVVRKDLKMLLGSSVGFVSTRPKSFANLAPSFFRYCSFGSSCKKSLFAIELTGSIKTEWIREVLADKELFSIKRFLRSIKLFYNSSRKGVYSFKINTLFNKFRTCEIVAPKVARSRRAISTA